MCAAAASLVAMAIVIRYLTPQYHVLLLIFLRNVLNLVLMTPWLIKNGASVAKTDRLARHGLRNAFLYSGNVAWFFAVTMVSLADLAALQFTSPLFTAILAAVFLSERIGLHRALAIVVGFAGALIIIRPGFEAVGAGQLVVLAAAFLYSCSYIVTKRLSDTESGNVVVFYMSVFILVYSAIPAFFVWQTPALEDWPLLIALALTGYATHYCLTRSMEESDASYVAPFEFTRLPISVLFGYLLFMEIIDPWTLAGAIVIFCAAYYNTWEETRQSKVPRGGVKRD